MPDNTKNKLPDGWSVTLGPEGMKLGTPNGPGYLPYGSSRIGDLFIAFCRDLLATEKTTPKDAWTSCSDRLPTDADGDPWGDIFINIDGEVSKTSVNLVRECADRSPTNEVWKAKWKPTGFALPK